MHRAAGGQLGARRSSTADPNGDEVAGRGRSQEDRFVRAPRRHASGLPLDVRDGGAVGASTAQAELLDDPPIALEVRAAEIVQQTTSLTDHLQKTPPAVMVLRVIAEMPRELFDPGGQERDLDRGRAVVVLPSPEPVDDLALRRRIQFVVFRWPRPGREI